MCEKTECEEGYPEAYEGSKLMVFYAIGDSQHSKDDESIVKYRPKNIIIELSKNFYKRRSVYFSKFDYSVYKHTSQIQMKTKYISESKLSYFTFNNINETDTIPNINRLGSIDFGFSGEVTSYKKYYTNILVIFAY